MSRPATVLHILRRLNCRPVTCHGAAIQHRAAISNAVHHRTFHETCMNTPGYNSYNTDRLSTIVRNNCVSRRRWLCSATVEEDDLNVYYPSLVKRIESGDIQLIDVRESNELQQWGQITNSVNIPLGQVKEAFDLPEDEFEARYSQPKPSPTDDDIVFHCRSGKRSLTALETVRSQGYSSARHFPGGWLEWAKENNLPAE